MARIERSLYTPRLFAGINRMFAVVLAIVCAIFIVYGSLISKILGCLIVIVIWNRLAKLNSLDYIFFTVLFRHLHQQNTYLTFSRNKSSKNNSKVARIKFTP